MKEVYKSKDAIGLFLKKQYLAEYGIAGHIIFDGREQFDYPRAGKAVTMYEYPYDAYLCVDDAREVEALRALEEIDENAFSDIEPLTDKHGRTVAQIKERRAKIQRIVVWVTMILMALLIFYATR